MSQHQRQPRERGQYEQQGQRHQQRSGGSHQQQPTSQQGSQQFGGQRSQQMGQQQPQQMGQQQPQQMGQQQPQQMGQQQPQQMGQQGQPGTGQHQPTTGQQFTQSVPQPIATAVEHLDRLETTAEFVDGRAIQQGNIHAARIADAIKDVAHLQKEFFVEENPMAREFGQCCQQVIQSGIGQLQGYQQQPEIQELVGTAQQTLESISSGLQAIPTGGQGTGQQRQY